MTIEIPTLDKAQKMIDDTKNDEYINETDGKKMITDEQGNEQASYPKESDIDTLLTKKKSELADESYVSSLINIKVDEFKDYKLYNWRNNVIPFTKIPISGSISKIVYGKDRFVAIGSSSAYWSTDGITWNSSYIQNYNWSSICYGQGNFVACATDYSCMAYSTNGITWSYSNPIAFTHWVDICYGNDIFVAVNSSYSSGTGFTEIAQSYNEKDWGAHEILVGDKDNNTNSQNWTFKEIAYGNGVFVAISNNSPYIAYSSVANSKIGYIYKAVENAPSNVGHICFATFNYTNETGHCYLVSYFLIVSPNTSTILTSTDGKSWSEITSNYSFPSIHGIYNYFGTTFILTNYGLFYSNRPFRYGEGCTWIPFGIEGDDGISTLAYGNGKMAVAGSGGYIITYSMVSDYCKKLLDLVYPVGSKMANEYLTYTPTEAFPCTFWQCNDIYGNNYYYKWQRIE